jgi:hypothetical protein
MRSPGGTPLSNDSRVASEHGAPALTARICILDAVAHLCATKTPEPQLAANNLSAARSPCEYSVWMTNWSCSEQDIHFPNSPQSSPNLLAHFSLCPIRSFRSRNSWHLAGAMWHLGAKL